MIKENKAILLWNLDDHWKEVFYEVRLNNGDWIDVGMSTHHTFYNLKDGKNTIEVLMKDCNGTIWKESVVLRVSKC